MKKYTVKANLIEDFRLYMERMNKNHVTIVGKYLGHDFYEVTVKRKYKTKKKESKYSSNEAIFSALSYDDIRRALRQLSITITRGDTI